MSMAYRSEKSPEDSLTKRDDTPSLWKALKRNQQLAVNILGVTLVGVGVLTLIQRVFLPKYEGSFQLLVSDPINKEGRERAANPTVEDMVIRPISAASIPDLVEVLKSPLLLSPVAKNLQIDANKLEKGVSIKTPNRQTEGVLKVTLHWHDPIEGEKVLTKLNQAYLEYSLLQRQEKLRQGLAFLDGQAPALQRRVAIMQQELSAFRRKYQLLEPSKKGEAIQEQRQKLESRLTELNQSQAQLNGLAEAVRAGQLTSASFQEPGKPKGNLGAGGSLASGAFSTLLTDVTNVEKELAEAEATYSSSSPIVRSLRARRARLRPLLQQRELDAIQAALQENRAQQAQIKRQGLQLEQEFADQPALIRRYDAIQQKLDVAKDNLTEYIKARENFRFEVAQRILPWQVIAPPKFNPKPVSPDPGRNLILAMMIGGVVGSGAAMLRERLDPLLHSNQDLSKDLQKHVLGSIGHLPLGPHVNLAAALAAMDPQQKHQLQESLRNLATHLHKKLTSKGQTMVGFTAGDRGEGTSTTALLIAQTLAELGSRVLLIDADLRQPTLHAAVGLANTRGLSNLLSDRDSSIESMIHTLPSGLDLITAGPRPEDSTLMMSSELCRERLQHLRDSKQHDLVIFDLPELLDRSDGLVLSSLINCCVLVVGLGVAQGGRVMQTLRHIDQSGSKLSGVMTIQKAIPLEVMTTDQIASWVRQKL
jgi:uncharacterized protein involved in exopolysaccharide biosynthesis/Mrp family chromosome partitioning ATPase